jgi:hypothetical protein
VADEVGLEALGEAPVQLDLGVVGLAALGAARVVPALEPEQHRRDEVALDVGAVGVGRARGLVGQRGEQRAERAAGPSGTAIVRPPGAAQQPTADDPPAAGQHLVAEAQHAAPQVLGAPELVHLPAADDRHRALPDGHGLTVDDVLARADRTQISSW